MRPVRACPLIQPGSRSGRKAYKRVRLRNLIQALATLPGGLGASWGLWLGCLDAPITWKGAGPAYSRSRAEFSAPKVQARQPHACQASHLIVSLSWWERLGSDGALAGLRCKRPRYRLDKPPFGVTPASFSSVALLFAELSTLEYFSQQANMAIWHCGSNGAAHAEIYSESCRRRGKRRRATELVFR